MRSARLNQQEFGLMRRYVRLQVLGTVGFDLETRSIARNQKAWFQDRPQTAGNPCSVPGRILEESNRLWSTRVAVLNGDVLWGYISRWNTVKTVQIGFFLSLGSHKHSQWYTRLPGLQQTIGIDGFTK